jgi:hypothetical protein
MTQINFRRGVIDYRAEVVLDSDLQLDEILEVERVAASGATYAVTDVTGLENAIEAAIGCRTAELRAARDAGRRRHAPSKRRALTEQILLVKDPPPAVESQATSEVITAGASATGAPEVVPNKEHRIMQFNLKGVAEKTGRATYQQEGGKLVVKLGKTAFEGNVVPDAITIEAPFKVKVVAAKMTKEERKAFNASRPKKTVAEKLAASEARTAKLRAELAL